MKKKLTLVKWNSFQTALWGYSIGMVVLLLFTICKDLILQQPIQHASPDPLQGLATYGPLLVFFVLLAVQYKKYRWNWKLIALEIYSLLFSSLFLFLVTVMPSPVHSHKHTPAAILISLLLFLPVFIHLFLLKDTHS